MSSPVEEGSPRTRQQNVHETALEAEQGDALHGSTTQQQGS
jgi:hypothetical protein